MNPFEREHREKESILREFAEKDPRQGHEAMDRGTFFICNYCKYEQKWSYEKGGFAYSHTDDCLWVRARKLMGLK